MNIRGVSGLVIAVGLYLMMGKRLLHLLLGIALLGNGVNMMIVTAAGLTECTAYPHG